VALVREPLAIDFRDARASFVFSVDFCFRKPNVAARQFGARTPPTALCFGAWKLP
jgi:hypothetical protein